MQGKEAARRQQSPLGTSVNIADFLAVLVVADAPNQVILEEADDRPSKLIVDANANGDLTDDPVGTWTSKPSHDPDGGDATEWQRTAGWRNDQ